MKTKLTLLIFLLSCAAVVWSQATTENLKGEWHSYKKTTLTGGDGSSETANGLPFSINITLDFTKDGNVNFKENGVDNISSYSLSNDVLIISGKKQLR